MRADGRRATVEEIFSVYRRLARRHFPEAGVTLCGAGVAADLPPAPPNALSICAAMAGKPVALLRLEFQDVRATNDGGAANDIRTRAAPLLDCLCREVRDCARPSLEAATLTERTEELQWLFGLRTAAFELQ